MPKSRRNDPCFLLHFDSVRSLLEEAIRELDGARTRRGPLRTGDVLDHLFTKRRQDPEARDLARRITPMIERLLAERRPRRDAVPGGWFAGITLDEYIARRNANQERDS